MATGLWIPCKWKGCTGWVHYPRFLCAQHWNQLASTEKLTIYESYTDAIQRKCSPDDYWALCKLVLHRHAAY